MPRFIVAALFTPRQNDIFSAPEFIVRCRDIASLFV